ncbi:hypothetical protein [Phaeobacter piscinae]|uniref:hypothetical protein n=1 Tax=Phaeobacter piscinae TaxID=1580596 RepID=UPI000C9BDA1D|nr:hypothetical protein [Phaeobacter piscinae]AUQ73794.1 hypothetical protein PhaeoP71_00913 [Phaeobacter piscinae]
MMTKFSQIRPAVSTDDPSQTHEPVSLSVKLRVPVKLLLLFSLALLLIEVAQKFDWWGLDQSGYEVPYIGPLTYINIFLFWCVISGGLTLSWAEVSSKGIATRRVLRSSSSTIPWSRVVAVQEKPVALRLFPSAPYRYAWILVRPEDGALTRLRCPLENGDAKETRRFQAAFASYWPDLPSPDAKAALG